MRLILYVILILSFLNFAYLWGFLPAIMLVAFIFIAAGAYHLIKDG